MSWSLSFSGRLTQAHDAGGQFAPGEVLPVELPEEAIGIVERTNPGSTEQAREVWAAARSLVASGQFGDPATSTYRVIIGGHFQNPGTATPSGNISITQL